MLRNFRTVRLAPFLLSAFGAALVSRAETITDPAPIAVTAVENDARQREAQNRVELAERSGNFPALVRALDDEADADTRARQFDEAEKLRLRLLQLQELHAGHDSLPVADALLTLGWFYANMARYEDAQEMLDRCLDLRQRLLGPQAAPVAEALNALGSLEENRNNLSLSESFYQQAIAIQEKTFGPLSDGLANTRNNLATLYWIMGRYAEAQRLFAQALAVREKALGPNSAVVAKTLDNLALLDVSLGDYDGAEAYFQRALHIRSARLGADNPATISTVSQLGQLYVREGDDVRAEPLLVEAVAAQQKQAPGGDPDLARGLEQLAQLDDRRKLFDKAGPLHDEALAMRRRLLGENHPETAASLASLARHAHAQGKLADALPNYQEALRIDTDALGPNHPDTLAVARDLSLLQIELRHPDEATGLAQEVSDAQRSVLNGVFNFAPEHQRMDFARTLQPCDLPAALADADLLAETVLRTKGVVLDSLLEDQAALRARRDPDVPGLLQKRRLLLAQLAEVTPAGDLAGPPPQVDRDGLQEQEREIESKLADKGAGDGQTRRSLATEVSDVREAMPADAALVEYIAYDRYLGRLNFQPAYGAVIILRDASCRWVPLGAAAEIDDQVRLGQKYMRKRVRDAALGTVLQDLHAALCAPVIAQLPSAVRSLIICPDGGLNFVSFATLLSADDTFFASQYDLRYVSSGRDLLRRTPSAPRTKRLVVFADPDYAHPPGAMTARLSRGHRSPRGDSDLAPLPGTEREASLVMAQAVQAGLDTILYRGGEASKVNLAQVVSPYVLHLATHGLFLPQSDLPSAPPMARSLLAFAGGGITLRAWKAGSFFAAPNDGLLTAEQAAGLNLDSTRLVVLSACDTGSGEARAGEGVLGLRRGFAEAGAQNLLMTLWPADDQVTADFMQAFYRDFLSTGDPPAAFSRVQRSLLVDARRRLGLFEAVRSVGPFVLSW